MQYMQQTDDVLAHLVHGDGLLRVSPNLRSIPHPLPLAVPLQQRGYWVVVPEKKASRNPTRKYIRKLDKSMGARGKANLLQNVSQHGDTGEERTHNKQKGGIKIPDSSICVMT